MATGTLKERATNQSSLYLIGWPAMRARRGRRYWPANCSQGNPIRAGRQTEPTQIRGGGA